MVKSLFSLYTDKELLDKAKTAPSMEKYKEIMWKAQEVWQEDVASVPLWELVFVSTIRRNVKGYIANPVVPYEYNLYDMYLED